MVYIVSIYIFIFAFTVVSLLKDGKQKKIAFFACFIALMILFSLRGKYGTDWVNYEEYYLNINNSAAVKDRSFEYGYYLINKIFYNLGFSYWTFVFVCSICLSLIFFAGLIKSGCNLEMVALASLIYFFYPSMEALRQAIALSLFFVSLTHINNWKSYFALNITGFFFHRTCIITLLFYFIYKFKYVKYFLFCIILLYIVFKPDLSFILEPLGLMQKFEHYSKYAAKFTGIKDLISIKSLEYLAMFVFYLSVKRKTKLDKLILTLLEIGLVIQLIMPFIIDAAYRLAYYTDMGLILAYGNLCSHLKKKSHKTAAKILIGSLVSLRFYRIISLNQELFGLGGKRLK